MSNELELERHQGLRLGFRVQRADAEGFDGPEGVLLAIHRDSPTKRFAYTVDWRNGEAPEELAPEAVMRSKFGDFPHWESDQAHRQRWAPGDTHYWIRFHKDEADGGSCLYCGKMRSVLASSDEQECRGPVSVELR
jgi:hypothetical protein